MSRDYSARSKNRAQYLPAGQSGTHSMPFRNPAGVRGGQLPASINSLADLDWLNPTNRFFTSDRALFSAGQFIGGGNPALGMFSKRPGVTILCDSGGLQYGLGRAPWLGQQSQAWSLNFLEANADEAITLDIPTVAITRGPPIFNSFQACLSQTLANNIYYHAHRSGRVRFLSVLQGTSAGEAQIWYQSVKALPFEGWAFAGALRRDYQHIASMALRLIADGLLGPDRNRIHVLGVSDLTGAVMLSALQRALRERLQDDALQITFDTSSPSKMAMAGDAYGYPVLTPGAFRISSFSPPSRHVHAGSAYRFPVAASRLSESLTLGDLSVSSSTRQHGWDTLGHELVVHHNIEAMFRAIEDANAVLEMPTSAAAQLAPPELVRCYNAVLTMFKRSNPLGHLRRFATDFRAL